MLCGKAITDYPWVLTSRWVCAYTARMPHFTERCIQVKHPVSATNAKHACRLWRNVRIALASRATQIASVDQGVTHCMCLGVDASILESRNFDAATFNFKE